VAVSHHDATHNTAKIRHHVDGRNSAATSSTGGDGRPSHDDTAGRTATGLAQTSINVDLAVAGRCGFTHIPSGRVCQLPYRHPGPCTLRYLAPAATPTRAGLGQHPTDSAPVTATERRSVTTRNVTPARCEEQI
jgi:hypothetical protein